MTGKTFDPPIIPKGLIGNLAFREYSEGNLYALELLGSAPPGKLLGDRGQRRFLRSFFPGK